MPLATSPGFPASAIVNEWQNGVLHLGQRLRCRGIQGNRQAIRFHQPDQERRGLRFELERQPSRAAATSL